MAIRKTRKKPATRNPVARGLRLRATGRRIEKPKKGKGSYRRKGRGSGGAGERECE
jgi:hypothetical protein